MVRFTNENYLDVGYLNGVKGVVIHNDAGSINATPDFYRAWLYAREKELGIAHYYVSDEEILRVVDSNKIAYHTGDAYGNSHYIGYEVCQSMGASDEQFLKNENMTLRQVAEDMLFYGLEVNEDTVRLHNEFSRTSCPHRSLELHGNNAELKHYFINKIIYYQSLGATVQEMLANETGETMENYVETVENFRKSDDEIVQMVLRGEFGNGEQRKQALELLGYDYETIQNKINALYGLHNYNSVNAVADEVIAGLWGNGEDRRARLENAGYNYDDIQALVNEKLGF